MENQLFRDNLKILTKPFHDRLEAHHLAVALAKGEISQEYYLRYLKALLNLHQQCEAKIIEFAEWQSHGINPLERSRLGLLKHDIEQFDEHLKEENQFLNFSIEWSFSSAVGVLYVLEGSTMGGQFLSRSLSHMVGADGNPITQYYQSYKEKTGLMWQEYCRFLDHYGSRASSAELDNAILAACAVFLHMQRIMDECV